MAADVSIKMPGGYLIIDTKFYKENLTGQYDQKLHSANLYQLFSYVKNIEKKGKDYQNCSGMLLYPTVKHPLNLNYEIQGHRIWVRTIDLSLDWRDIHQNLLELVHDVQKAGDCSIVLGDC
jgi:5-methylcytosine-specific restriction enzyme subunit McrC